MLGEDKTIQKELAIHVVMWIKGDNSAVGIKGDKRSCKMSIENVQVKIIYLHLGGVPIDFTVH